MARYASLYAHVLIKGTYISVDNDIESHDLLNYFNYIYSKALWEQWPGMPVTIKK